MICKLLLKPHTSLHHPQALVSCNPKADCYAYFHLKTLKLLFSLHSSALTFVNEYLLREK